MKDSTFQKYCLVVDEWFVNGWNGTAAYQKYYPKASKATADVEFRRILEIPRIKEYVDKKQEEAKVVLGVEKHEVLKILRDWLYSDITELIGVSPEEIKKLPVEVRRLITEFEHTKFTNESGTTEKIKLKFMSKKDAAEMINKHIGFYEEHNKQKSGERTVEEMLALREKLRNKMGG